MEKLYIVIPAYNEEMMNGQKVVKVFCHEAVSR